eukprot:7605619-Pyramimonas_sp.AAC.1
MSAASIAMSVPAPIAMPRSAYNTSQSVISQSGSRSVGQPRARSGSGVSAQTVGRSVRHTSASPATARPRCGAAAAGRSDMMRAGAHDGPFITIL